MDCSEAWRDLPTPDSPGSTVVTTTVTPLQCDPACEPDHQCTSGVLQSVVAGHVTTTTYHGCGVPPTIQ